MKKQLVAVALLTASLVCGIAGFAHVETYRRMVRLPNVATSHEVRLVLAEALVQLGYASRWYGAAFVLAVAALILSLAVIAQIKRQEARMSLGRGSGRMVA